jgi:hypothetical protein
VAICEATTFDKIRCPERTTAAPVSSQELSMPSMSASGIMRFKLEARSSWLAASSTLVYVMTN